MHVMVELGYTPALAEMAFDPEVHEVDPRTLPAPERVAYDVGYAPVAVPGQIPRVRPPEPPWLAPFEIAPEPQSCTYLVRADVGVDQVDALRAVPEVRGVYADPAIEPFVACPGSPAIGDDSDVRRLLGVDALAQAGFDGRNVLVAIVDSGINVKYLRGRGLEVSLDGARSWTPGPGMVPEEAPVDHGTMCAYDALLAAPRCTLLDVQLLQSTRVGPTPISGLLSDAVRAFRHLFDVMRTLERQSLVVNNSWGMFDPAWDLPPGDPGNYSDNPAHPFNRIVAELDQAGADIVFAAGNCGPECPDRRCQGNTANAIYGANGSPSVTCVGGVDTQRERVGYSTVGPGRLSREKPDVLGYTHFRGSGVYPVDGGTSAAAPVVAGLVAAVRSGRPYDPTDPGSHPGAIRELVASTATDLGPPGFDFAHGHGVVNGGALLARLRPPLLVQFRHRGRTQPTLEDAALRLGVELEQVDPDYGLVKIADEPAGPLYVCQIQSANRDEVERALSAARPGEERDPAEGVFANPPISPFGPPQ